MEKQEKTRRPLRRDNLVESVLDACRHDPVLAPAAEHVVVVGVSGGPDSTALLHALARCSRRLSLRLVAAHVDHGLRAASATDSAAAAALAAELGVPFEFCRVHPGGGDEDSARRARHAALESVAARAGAGTIALGHTADDQAETVLLHLLRGSGLEGIAAMRMREGLRFRPLLGTWRAHVEAYCAAQGLHPVHDASNDDVAFTRNRVRGELLPLLEARYNPRVKDALVRLARAAATEHEAIVTMAATWLRRHPRQLPRDPFNRLPEAVRAEVLRRAWQRAAALPRPPGDARRLEQALRLLAGTGGGMINLGGGFELNVDGSEFGIRRREGPS